MNMQPLAGRIRRSRPIDALGSRIFAELLFSEYSDPARKSTKVPRLFSGKLAKMMGANIFLTLVVADP